MSAREVEETKETGLSTVVMIGVFNASLGALLGFFFMASFPAKSFSTMADYESYSKSEEFVDGKKPGSAHFFRTDPARGRSWEVKRNQLVQGSGRSITISSEEINSWIVSRFVPPSLENVESPIAIAPGVPNFSAQDDDNVYLSIPLVLRMFGMRYDRNFYAKVAFSEGPNIRLELDRAYIDCAPIPHAMIGTKMYERLHDSFRFTDEYKEMAKAWERVESVDVAGGALTLNLR
ncbi:MAG: hypothetical protein HRT56_00060 [Coraliomargarita sp.]|nr:hypothetical protein [Coraliomargarita sp.]